MSRLTATIYLLLGMTAAHAAPAGAPVRFDGEVLFYVHDYFGGMSPDERAQRAGQQIAELADDPFYTVDRFSTDEAPGLLRILYDGKPLGAVTDEDAASAQMTKEELASHRLHTVEVAIRRNRERRRPARVTEALIESLIATGLFVLALFGVHWGYRRLLARSDASRASWLITRLETQLGLSADRVLALERATASVVRTGAMALVAAIYLQAVFTILPPTRGYALAVLRYLIAPLGRLWTSVLRNIGDLFTIAVLIALMRVLLKLLRSVLHGTAEHKIRLPGIAPEWGIPLYKIIRMVVIALGAVMIYPYIPGSGTAAFKGVSLFAGALFTLGATGTVGNFVGGLVAIFTGAFRIGDWIKIGDVTGEVVETTMVLTRIRTPKNEMVTVPNTAIMNGQLVNYTVMAREVGVILHTSVTIGYDAPWRKVHALLIDAAGRTSRLLADPPPFVLQTSLDDFFVSYEINAYTHEPKEMLAIYAELHRNIQDAFNAAGVEIMSPHYRSLRDGNTVTIPEGERPEGYAAPAYTVRVERAGP